MYIKEYPYGSLLDEVLNKQSSLHTSSHDFLFIFVRLEDLLWSHPQQRIAELYKESQTTERLHVNRLGRLPTKQHIHRSFELFERFIEAFCEESDNSAAFYPQTYLFLCPSPSSWYMQSPNFCQTIRSHVMDLQKRLIINSQSYSNFTFVTDYWLISNILCSRPGITCEGYPSFDPHYYDPQLDLSIHSPYSLSFTCSIALLCARAIATQRAPVKKVIVLDCDNTIWQGAVGELGAQGIQLTSEFLAVQRFASDMQKRGFILCLASKNIEEDVVSVFETRDDMILSLDQITLLEVHWRSKSGSIKAICKTLGLGLESVIFIDDNPIECAEVLASCPAVLAIQLPTDMRRIRGCFDFHWGLVTYAEFQHWLRYDDVAPFSRPGTFRRLYGMIDDANSLESKNLGSNTTLPVITLSTNVTTGDGATLSSSLGVLTQPLDPFEAGSELESDNRLLIDPVDSFSVFSNIVIPAPTTASFTAEDKNRTKMYKDHLQRQSSRKEYSDFASFFKSLSIRVQSELVSSQTLSRASQLTIRTNQLNCDKCPLDVPTLSKLTCVEQISDDSQTPSADQSNEVKESNSTNEPSLHLEIVKVSDKFGDYGVVGLMGCKTDPNEALGIPNDKSRVFSIQDGTTIPLDFNSQDNSKISLSIDNISSGKYLPVSIFLLSCRVLQRGIEHYMIRELSRLVKEKVDLGGSVLHGISLPWKPTDRNTPMRQFLKSIHGSYFVPEMKRGFLDLTEQEQRQSLMKSQERILDWVRKRLEARDKVVFQALLPQEHLPLEVRNWMNICSKAATDSSSMSDLTDVPSSLTPSKRSRKEPPHWEDLIRSPLSHLLPTPSELPRPDFPPIPCRFNWKCQRLGIDYYHSVCFSHEFMSSHTAYGIGKEAVDSLHPWIASVLCREKIIKEQSRLDRAFLGGNRGQQESNIGRKSSTCGNEDIWDSPGRIFIPLEIGVRCEIDASRVTSNEEEEAEKKREAQYQKDLSQEGGNTAKVISGFIEENAGNGSVIASNDEAKQDDLMIYNGWSDKNGIFWNVHSQTLDSVCNFELLADQQVRSHFSSSLLLSHQCPSCAQLELFSKNLQSADDTTIPHGPEMFTSLRNVGYAYAASISCQDIPTLYHQFLYELSSQENTDSNSSSQVNDQDIQGVDRRLPMDRLDNNFEVNACDGKHTIKTENVLANPLSGRDITTSTMRLKELSYSLATCLITDSTGSNNQSTSFEVSAVELKRIHEERAAFRRQVRQFSKFA